MWYNSLNFKIIIIPEVQMTGIKNVRIQIIVGVTMLLMMQQSAWGWGPHTHVFFGWKASMQMADCPGTDQFFYPFSNMQPDLTHICSTNPAVHADRRFPMLMLDEIAVTDQDRGYAYGWIDHQIADYWGHTFYIPVDEMAHFLAELGVDCVIYNSPDRAEKLFARTATVAWNARLTYDTSVVYSALYGGDPIPQLQWNLCGIGMADLMAAEKAIIGSRFFYSWASRNFPRTDWQIYMDDAIQEMVGLCNPPNKDNSYGPGSKNNPETSSTIEWPDTAITFLQQLGNFLKDKGAAPITLNKTGDVVEAYIQMAD